AEAYDVDPGPEVTQDLNRRRQGADEVPEELTDEFVTAMNTEAYVTSVLRRVGEASLRSEGVRRPGQDAAMQRGSELFGQWATEADVSFDPRYGVDVEEGQLVPNRGGTSFPVSEQAEKAW